jgi:glycyl-tRNA synthetase
VALKRNVMNLWWKMFVEEADNMYGVDAAILMNSKVWQASGHTKTFTDPLIECSNCHAVFRADKIDTSKCPSCGQSGTFGQPLDFNLMLRTHMGASWGSYETDEKVHVGGTIEIIDNETKQKKFGLPIKEGDTYNSVTIYEKSGLTYLRPETAQGIFTNFKNVVDTLYPDLPFGIAQQGKAFRNEISPRDFIFRDRELEQMEIEYFVHPDQWEEAFNEWMGKIHDWCDALGLPKGMVHELEVPEDDRAHYSKRTVDFEFDFPIGREELLGLAYRTDFDLKNIQDKSGKSMEYRPKDGGEPFIPHVIEPSFGVERALMAVLTAAYKEDEQNGEKRVFLSLPAHLAPVKVAVLPLAKNKPELVDKAREVYAMLKKEFGAVMWVDTGNIGKNYRKMDEIGTPYCVTVDYDTIEDNTVTVRHRDTTEQKRVAIVDIVNALV